MWARNGQLGPPPAGLTARCDTGCVFSHPSPLELTINVEHGDYVCPFGSACLEKKCPFLHLSGKARVLDIAFGNLVCGRVDQPSYFKDVVRPSPEAAQLFVPLLEECDLTHWLGVTAVQRRLVLDGE